MRNFTILNISLLFLSHFLWAMQSDLKITPKIRVEDKNEYVLIDVCNQSGQFLSLAHKDKEVRVCDFCPPTPNLLMSVQEMISKKCQKSCDIKIYSDFDGVLAKPIVKFSSLLTKKDYYFKTIFLASNCILEKQYKRAFTKENLEPFFRDLKIAAENILGKDWLSGESKKNQLNLVKKFFAFVDKGILHKEEGFESYNLSYEPVSEDLTNFYSGMKKGGAELFVLSARPKDRKKLEFLGLNYRDVFTDYIYALNKDQVLIKSPSLINNTVVVFIDDYVQKVAEYANTMKVKKTTEEAKNESPEYNFIFVPFPQISKEFEAKDLIREILDLAITAEDNLCQKFREKEAQFIKERFEENKN